LRSLPFFSHFVLQTNILHQFDQTDYQFPVCNAKWLKNGKLRKPIFAFYNISQRNFGILLILWCSFKLWWNFCPDLSRSKFHSKGGKGLLRAISNLFSFFLYTLYRLRLHLYRIVFRGNVINTFPYLLWTLFSYYRNGEMMSKSARPVLAPPPKKNNIVFPLE
jgi:hypothetical protein